MANQFLDAVEYAKAFLILLKNQLVMGKLVTGEFRDQVTDENGLSINIKRPPRFIANDGATLNAQDIVTGSTNVVVDQYKNVHVRVGDLESVQSFNDLMRNETIQSAASELAHTIDGSLQVALQDFYSSVGTVGLDIASPIQFNAVHTRLMNQAVPNENLYSVVSFADGAAIRGNLQASDIQGINRMALERVRIPIISEVDLFASNNLRAVTAGTRAQTGASLVNGANQNVNYADTKDTNTQTLAIDGLTSGQTISKGEVFTIAGVFAINPRSRVVLPYLQQFVVMADATASGAGEVDLTISPPIVVANTGTGDNQDINTQFANVSAAPADNAAISYEQAPGNTSTVRAAFHRRSISLVSARLQMPFTGEASFVTDPETGIGIRYWRGSDISTGQHIHRWDTIYGVQNIQPLLGARVSGTTP